MNEVTGAGIYCPQTEMSITILLGHYITVFQTKIYGILIYICCDCQGTLKALNGYTLSLECRELQQLISTVNFVSLIWVRGHCGVLVNEQVDKLGREEANLSHKGLFINIVKHHKKVYSNIFGINLLSLNRSKNVS